MTAADFIRQRATPAHRAAARELATALAIWRSNAFVVLAQAFRRHLTSGEAMMTAFAALRAVEPVDLPIVLHAALPDRLLGAPLPPLLLGLDSLIGDAELWSASASPTELRAFALAALARLPHHERWAILRALEGRARK